MATWMYVIREFEDGIDDCDNCDDVARGCNDNSADASINAWDEGVAFAIGSLEGKEGNSRKVGTKNNLTGTAHEYGVGFYALAERRCIDFRTCANPFPIPAQPQPQPQPPIPAPTLTYLGVASSAAS